jgi:hypothetical protein
MPETMPQMFGGEDDKSLHTLRVTGDGWRVIRAALRDAQFAAEDEAKRATEELRTYHGDSAHHRGVDAGAAHACNHCYILPGALLNAEMRAARYASLAWLVTATLGEGDDEGGTAGEGCGD